MCLQAALAQLHHHDGQGHVCHDRDATSSVGRERRRHGSNPFAGRETTHREHPRERGRDALGGGKHALDASPRLASDV